MSRAKIFSLERKNNELQCNNNEREEFRRRAQNTSSATVGWGDIQNFESYNSFNTQTEVDIATSPLNINTPVDRHMITRTENSAFIATGALYSTPEMPPLINERDIRSRLGAENYFTPA